MALTVDESQPIKRAPVVYGKQYSNNLSTSTLIPVGGPAQSSGLSARSVRLDAERSPSPDAVSSFQFDFRHKLKELDEQFDERGMQPQPAASSDEAVGVGSSQVRDFQSVSMDTPALSPPNSPHSSWDAARASLSLSLAVLRATAQKHPPDSPPVHQRTRRIPNPILSDSEAEAPSSSSSVSPVRHVITTPHMRSSPTPPTSRETPTVSRMAKGRAPARNVLPLVFDGKQPSSTKVPNKSKKERKSDSLPRLKTKAPSKKERHEAALESSRIAASRPVEVIRTEEKKHTISAFFASLRRDHVAATTSGIELPSDPIERFSSPTDRPALHPQNNAFGTPTGLLGPSVETGTDERTLSSNSKALPPAAADSDDEMPSLASIIQQVDGAELRLRAIKRVALKHANANNNDSEDDDLLIVKDDMHSVAREEAVQRRLGKVHGSPAKNQVSSRVINHPSVRPTMISPCRLSKQELQELAKPSFARREKHVRGLLSKKQLDQLMMMRHDEEQQRSIKWHEEEWEKKGGTLSRNTGGDATQSSFSQMLGLYAEQALKSAELVNVVGNEANTEESDEDYAPDSQGPASPEPVVESGVQDDDMGSSPVLRLAGDEHDGADDANDEYIMLRRSKYGQRRPLIVGSDDEEMQPVRSNLPTAQRDSGSSMESQTEDENDKENKAIVHHVRSFRELTSGSRLGSLHGVEDNAQRNLLLASALPEDTTGSPVGDVRSPLKDISKDENDVFFSPSSKPLFTGHLLQGMAGSPPRTSLSTLGFELSPVLRSEHTNRIGRFSLDSANDMNESPGFKASQPSFLERLQRQANPEPSLAPLDLPSNGEFSQMFSAEDLNSRKPVHGTSNDGLSLTLDVGLKPALEVSSTLRQKAEIIFEKEQEYVVADAIQQDDKPKDHLYVNDHGFLTQTRPEVSSPQIYRMTPLQVTNFDETRVHASQTQTLSIRPPLRTLSLATAQGDSPEQRSLKRLRKRSPSPLEQKMPSLNSTPATRLNAFDILGKIPVPLSKVQSKKMEKSEFVAVEAEESDEDDMFGFGGPKNDDDEEDDSDQDKAVEGLVDDTFMDAQTESAELVQEKYREHEEEDDQRLQKLHEDAIKGKFRTKRRNGEVGFEDDSDEDEDEDERRIRQRIYKKRRIQDDDLEALGQNEETRAFYDTYHQDLIDEDDEFGYLRDHAPDPEDVNIQTEEPQDIVTPDEIRQRAREMAQSKYEVELLDPEDTSWVDQTMTIEPDDTIRVRMVECRRSEPVVQRANVGQMDFDEERSTRNMANEQERKQLTSWAKCQNPRQGTGRSGTTTAITGHTKAKSKGGSLRPTEPLKPETASAARKTKKAASLLSMVSNRSGKFA